MNIQMISNTKKEIYQNAKFSLFVLHFIYEMTYRIERVKLLIFVLNKTISRRFLITLKNTCIDRSSLEESNHVCFIQYRNDVHRVIKLFLKFNAILHVNGIIRNKTSIDLQIKEQCRIWQKLTLVLLLLLLYKIAIIFLNKLSVNR
jgi:hypothetical protein